MNKQVERIVSRLEELGAISDDSNCLSRFCGTPAHDKAAKVLMAWMTDIGMTVTKDIIGNIRGILLSQCEDAKHFVVGSHYDTVYNAGKYDGPLGILLGLEMAQRVADEQIELPFHLNIVAFADEEGSRFNTAYLGSSVLAGNFETSWLERRDDTGVTIAQLIEERQGVLTTIGDGQILPEEWLGYFEAHIEQGPVLCDQDLPLCLVSSIAAQTRVNVTWTGISGHAGTSPMDLRSDALCAAAEFALMSERIGHDNKEQLVATIGKLQVLPNTSNVIPGLVKHTLDVRSPNDTFLVGIVKKIETLGREIAERRGLDFDFELMQSNASVACDATLKELLRTSIQKGNIDRLVEIPSGAGHDGVMISKVAPVSMLFVRCKEGISHNPLEYADPEDIKESLIVCNHFIDELIVANKK